MKVKKVKENKYETVKKYKSRFHKMFEFIYFSLFSTTGFSENSLYVVIFCPHFRFYYHLFSYKIIFFTNI